MNHFIFGYGTLINEESRAKTGKKAQAIPVRLSGIARSWNLIVPSIGMTAVGTIEHEKAICNGVLFPVDSSDLILFDEREIPFGYRRIQIDNRQVTRFPSGILPRGAIWTYITEIAGIPSEGTPIVQSYLDVIMTGCLSFNESFAQEFIATTMGWENPWINDRLAPRYPRALEHVPLAKTIDRILEKSLPSSVYNSRK